MKIIHRRNSLAVLVVTALHLPLWWGGRVSIPGQGTKILKAVWYATSPPSKKEITLRKRRSILRMRDTERESRIQIDKEL